jgi:transposase
LLRRSSMQVVYERCAGLDVHKKTVVACVMTPAGRETRSFPTMTGDLLALADWLLEHDVTHVAMESTGVYWRPVYNLLEGMELTLLVVNAQHIKAVPGRKTDVRDAEWIADLLRHGLLRGSYIPDRAQRELRELVRYRKSLIQERSREANRIQKVLEGANIKLASVASDVLGVSGRAMLQAIIGGCEDPEELAGLARGSLRNKRTELARALQGLLGSHQRLLLATQLEHIEFLERQTAKVSEEIADRMLPFEEAICRLDSIPGIGRRAAEEILVETGVDMSRFPTSAHLASWAGVCPGNNESAGKRKTGRARKGNRWLRTALVEAARATAHTRDTYLAAQYHRIAARRGPNRASLAVAHTILVTLYHLLSRATTYEDPGGNYFDERAHSATLRRTVRRIERLGYKVTLQTA